MQTMDRFEYVSEFESQVDDRFGYDRLRRVGRFESISIIPDRILVEELVESFKDYGKSSKGVHVRSPRTT